MTRFRGGRLNSPLVYIVFSTVALILISMHTYLCGWLRSVSFFLFLLSFSLSLFLSLFLSFSLPPSLHSPILSLSSSYLSIHPSNIWNIYIYSESLHGVYMYIFCVYIYVCVWIHNLYVYLFMYPYAHPQEKIKHT